MDQNLIEKIIEYFLAGLLGSIGAVASFFYEVDKGRRFFNFRAMLFVSVIGFVVGSAAGSFIPEGDNWYGLTLIVGLNSYPIIGAMRERVGPALDKILKKFTG